MRLRASGSMALLSALLIAATSPGLTAAAPRTKLVSRDHLGAPTDAASGAPATSRTGRYIAFESAAALVPEDTNGAIDVYVRDERSGTTMRVSVASDGSQGTGDSTSPAISADGRFVAFASAASELVAGDTNAARDIFVHDRKRGRTRRVSVSRRGRQASGSSATPSISANGRFVAFRSAAADLVRGDTNETTDIFVHDRWKGRTRRVSVRSNGAQARDASANPAISANGRFIAFDSLARNLVAKDTNGAFDVFVHDRRTRRTQRVSLSSKGRQVNDASRRPAISEDGRFIAFDSFAGDIAGNVSGYRDVYVRDRRRGTTRLMSRRRNGAFVTGSSRSGSISDDGRYVAFASVAGDLVGDDVNGVRDVFVRDRRSRRIRLVSRSTLGAVGDRASEDVGLGALAGNGRYIVFGSSATNLVAVDGNGAPDVFRRGPLR